MNKETSRHFGAAWLARVCVGLALGATAAAGGCSNDSTPTTQLLATEAGIETDGATADVATADGSTSTSCPLTTCGSACVDTANDPANCGACGTACQDGQICSKGTCALTCGAGTTKCGATCNDTKSDPNNCGGCGTKCNTGEVCNNGSCGLVCTGGTTKCGSACVDSKLDPANCGGCGKVCGAGRVCSNGACQDVCGTGLTSCGGGDAGDAGGTRYCANIQADNANCGGCGNACHSGEACVAGACVVSCPGNQINCNGSCVDPSSDRVHCGATAGCGGDAGTAGTACANGQVCNGGTCSVSCPGNQLNCNDSCVDPMTDRDHCGATGACGNGGGSAGTACANGQVCNSGTCSVSCPGSQVNCNGVCVDPNTDRTYCGATGACGNGGGSAGTACANGQVCNGGACSVSCPGSQVNCNGVCVDPATDNAHCGASGACGNGGGSAGATCGAGKVCSNGSCTATCAAPLINCGGACVDPRNDPAHCNGCNACASVANASNPVCRSSACVVGTCSAGHADCNGTYSDGCETNTASDANNCGGCGNKCGAGAPYCSNGVCISLYAPVGPQTNIPVANLSGWSQCYTDTYANSSTSLATIQAQCTKAKLMLACRPTGSSTIQLLAWAPRTDVLFDTGTGNTPHNSNGTGWYFNGSWSWGFAQQGDPITRNSCDTQDSSLGSGANGQLRLCWHTGSNNINSGWRCGKNDSIFSGSYDRIVYQAD